VVYFSCSFVVWSNWGNLLKRFGIPLEIIAGTWRLWMSVNPLNGSFFLSWSYRSIHPPIRRQWRPSVLSVLCLSISLSIPLPIYSLTRPLVYPTKHQHNFVTTAPFDWPTWLHRCPSCAARYLWLCSSPDPLDPPPPLIPCLAVNERFFPLGNGRTRPS